MADMSFLPEDYLEKKAQLRTNLILLVLFALEIGAVAAAFFVTDHRWVRRQYVQVNAQYEEAAKRLEQLETLQARKQQMMRKAQVTATLLERVPRSLILSEITNSMPLSMCLTEMNLETRLLRDRRESSDMTLLDQAKRKAGAKNDSDAKPTEVTLQLQGMAPTDMEVAQFMAALGRSPLFQQVNLGFSEQASQDERTVRKFRVDLKLNQDIDLRKFEPQMVQGKTMRNPLRQPQSAGGNPGISITPSPTAPPPPKRSGGLVNVGDEEDGRQPQPRNPTMRFGIRETIFILLLLAVPVVAYFSIFAPRNADRDAIVEEIRQRQAKLQQLEATTRNLTDLGQEIDKLSQAIDLFEAKLPAQREVEVVLRQVWEMATKEHLNPKSIRTDKPVAAHQYSELPIKMVIVGDFDGFYRFMLQLEKLRRVTRMPKLQIKKISSEEGQLQADIVLSVFFDSGDNAAATPRKERS